MGVHLKPHLPAGTYTATYRVVSADGHIVSSGFNFSIGHPGAPGQAVSRLIGGSGTAASTEVAFGVARGLQYAAIAVGVGALLFLLIVWLPALALAGGGGKEWRAASSAVVARLRMLVIGASAVGLVSAAAGVVLEAASAADISAWSALSPRIVREELHTHFGTVWGVAVLAWALHGCCSPPSSSPHGASEPPCCARPSSGPPGSRCASLGRVPGSASSASRWPSCCWCGVRRARGQPAPNVAAVPDQRAPRARDERLARWSRGDTDRTPSRHAAARHKRPHPSARRLATALLGPRVGVRGPDHGVGADPGATSTSARPRT